MLPAGERSAFQLALISANFSQDFWVQPRLWVLTGGRWFVLASVLILAQVILVSQTTFC